MEAKQTPLIDLLERVPRDAVLVVEHDQFSSSSYSIGRLCHEAAAELRRLHIQRTHDALQNSSLAAPTLLGLKHFIERELAKIEPLWVAAGKGSYWWGVRIGLETVLAKLCEMEDQALATQIQADNADANTNEQIAACDPDTIRALLDERNTLATEVERLRVVLSKIREEARVAPAKENSK